MFKVCFPSLLLVIVTTGFSFTDSSTDHQEPARTPVPNATPPAAPRTVQILLGADGDVLVENSDGKRTGLDFKSGKFVDEIPGARVISGETSTTYVLPFDKSGKPYKVSVSGKSAAKVDADLSMTGPGFVVGFRGLQLISGQVQKMSIAANGLQLSFTPNQDGPTPQLFLTAQSGRGKPSYRFEVSSLLPAGKTITVNLATDKGCLYFKTDDVKKDSFTVKMRRTNPSGTRDLFAHQDISFSQTNSYAMDFGQWDGKSDVCFYSADDFNSAEKKQCTRLRSDASSQ